MGFINFVQLMQKKRLITSIGLIFILLFGILKNSMLLGFYLLDNSNFTEIFCENKEKPELHCNGKCELSKLAKESENQNKHSLIQITQDELIIYFNSDFKTDFPLDSSEKIVHQFFYLNHYSYDFSQLINHPPALV
ncbi:MAG: hypothetical protein PHC38_00930 [Weeksellaceae bacterium]|nr:hypothetical protein [Weeksellaceae bacterium]